MNIVADRGVDYRPRVRHVLIAASVLAHLSVIAWIVCSGLVEQIKAAPESYVVGFAPRLPCANVVWIEHQHGCVVTRRPVCARAKNHDRDERRGRQDLQGGRGSSGSIRFGG
jgi:hypothetical protein